MNKRQVVILWIIAIALAAAVAVVKLADNEDTQNTTRRGPGQTLFESFPATEVTGIEIQGATGKVSLLRKDGAWTVAERDGYPANTTYVNDLLRTLAELKVTRGMEAGPSFAPRFGMDPESTKPEDRGLTATFKDASGNELATVSLGKNISGAPGSGPMGGNLTVGRYIRNHADESGFYAVGEMFTSVTDEVNRWLDDAFINPERIQSVSLSAKNNGDTEWKVVRESEEAEFKLDGAAGGEVADTTATSAFKSLFSYARFNDVLPAGKLAERAKTEEQRSALIETFDGFTYRLTITPDKESADQMLLAVGVEAALQKKRNKETNETPDDAKVKDEAFANRLRTLTGKLEKEKRLEGRTFVVSKSTLDALLKDRSQMLAKAAESAADGASGGQVQQLPGGIIATPPANATRGEAVTPPVSVPPLEDDKPQE